MNLLISRILAYLNGTLIYDDYYRFCIYIVYHFPMCEDITKQNMIDSGIKEESIDQFCKLLGVDNFSGFQKELIDSYLLRVNQIRTRLFDMRCPIMVERLVQNCQNENLEEELEQIYTAIYHSKRIILIGAMYPMSIGVELQTDLITCGKIVLNYNDYDPDMVLHKDDVVIFVSATGRSMAECLKAQNEVSLKQITSILVTQNKMYMLEEFKNTTHTICVSGRYDGVEFNYHLMNFFDVLRIQYYQHYYIN
ncbi:SIS domain-containing protein [Tannockella kyphosi]|uniref:SIS domain-containing protein n=1 Tax=Tannockella kyphosi TaxID=2899121 RepID=UPI002011C54B|nr:SIS domain-containing protein [Tannockella kyphosi]